MIEVREHPTYFALSGMATTWSRPYFVNDPDQGTFLERFERGSFSNATTGGDNVELRCDHRETPSYASTIQRSLKVVDEANGLLLAAALRKSNPANASLVASIKDGTRKGLSVGFRSNPDRETWGIAMDGRTALRTISDALLIEVSVVHRPANPAAKILHVRHETRSADGIEYRSFPLVYRDVQSNVDGEGPGDIDEVPMTPCLACGGEGTTDTGAVCPTCHGTGQIAASDEDADDRSYVSSVAVDATRTHAHLMDTILSNQAHAIRHHQRLGDADVGSSRKQIDFHIAHLGAHMAEVQGHVLKLDDSLAKTTHNPAQYVAERNALKENRKKEPVRDALDRVRLENLKDDARLDLIRAGMPDQAEELEDLNEGLTSPPNLRHGDLKESCRTCAWSGHSRLGGLLHCARYDEYLVRGDATCDSWSDREGPAKLLPRE